MTHDEISALHFEAHGVHPSPGFWAWWDLCTEDGKQEVLDGIRDALDDAIRDALDEQAYSQR